MCALAMREIFSVLITLAAHIIRSLLFHSFNEITVIELWCRFASVPATNIQQDLNEKIRDDFYWTWQMSCFWSFPSFFSCTVHWPATVLLLSFVSLFLPLPFRLSEGHDFYFWFCLCWFFSMRVVASRWMDDRHKSNEMKYHHFIETTWQKEKKTR